MEVTNCMRKKIICILLVSILSAIAFSGCGDDDIDEAKKNPKTAEEAIDNLEEMIGGELDAESRKELEKKVKEKIQDDSQDVEESDIDIELTEYEDAQGELEDFEYEDVEGESEEAYAAQENPLPKRAPEWEKGMTPDDSAFQVFDVFFQPGMLIGDVMEQVKHSSYDFTSDYNGDKLIVANEGSTQNVNIYLDDEPVFSFTVAYYNIGETITLKECPIVFYEYEEISQPYCYYLDGISLDDLTNMDYNTAKAYIEKWAESAEESEWEIKEDSGTNIISIACGLKDIQEKIPAPYTDEDRFKVKYRPMYVLRVDANTGMLKSVDQSVFSYNIEANLGDLVTSADMLPDNAKEELFEYAIQCCSDYYVNGSIFNYSSIDRLDTDYIEANEEGRTYVIIHGIDHSKDIYIVMEYKDVYIDKDGKISFTAGNSHTESTLEKAQYAGELYLEKGYAW